MLPRFWPFENAWVGVVSLAWAETRVLENGRILLRRFCLAKPTSPILDPHSNVERNCPIRGAIFTTCIEDQGCLGK